MRLPSLPWQRESDEPEEGAAEERAYGEPEGEPEGDEPEERPQGLEAFPEEIRGAAEAYAREQVEAERAKFTGSAKKRGFVFDESGELGVSDYGQVVGWLAPGDGRPEAAPPAPQAAAPVADDPKPDRFEQPDEYEAWLMREQDRRMTAAVEKAIAPLKAENERLMGVVQHRETGDALGNRLREAVQQYNPYVEAALDHPEFAAAFKHYAAQIPLEQLQQPQFLAQAAGFVAGALGPNPNPNPAPRDAQGRFTPGRDPAHEAARAAMERGQGRESGPVSRAEAPQRLSAEEQEVMRQIERFGGSMSREEWDALEATDIHRYGQRMERSRQRTRR